jgi:gamma-glutamylaminecyclotransferase
MLIFVYGTLKRGGSNHEWMQGQQFVTEAATTPDFLLYDLGGYPGMIRVTSGGLSILGEIWEVDEPGLSELDELEDLDGKEYAREKIPLLSPHEDWQVEGYRYLKDISSRPPMGDHWPV